jgi:prephenate dehydratase
MKVAIQGERGSFSHEAVLTFLGKASLVTCSLSADVFDRLQQRSVDAALIPLENSLAGSVAEHYDLMLSRDVHIQQEFRLRIRHNLIAAPGVKLKDVRRVYSHPVALDQCREFFRQHPSATAVPFYDTAGSVKHVIESGLNDAAAIAGKQSATEYGGEILKSGLEDDKQNFTRFVLISRSAKKDKKADKTSVCFSMKNVPGGLFKALSVFALRDISLSKIESRPRRGHPWEYVFYVDILAGDEEPARKALDHLREISDFVKVLGIYPSAKD